MALCIASAAAAAYTAPASGRMNLQHHRAAAPIMQAKLESPIPGMERPSYLDGTLAADAGFDPLGYTTKSITLNIPVNKDGLPWSTADSAAKSMEVVLGPDTDDVERSLMWMRESEIKHARLAMLAAAGWPLAELWHGGLARLTGADYLLDVTQGRSLSVLNGGLGEVAPFLFFTFVACAVVECSTLDNVYGLTATGVTMKKDGNVVMKSYVPGDCGFDPLNLYTFYNANAPMMDRKRAETDAQFNLQMIEKSRREMETAEIKNGRLAMLAITGYAIQEAVYGTPVVDQTPLFFTFFGDIIAPGSTASLGLY